MPPTDDELLAKLAKETICQKPLDSPLRAARGKESNGRRETRENQPALLAQSPEEMFDVDESPAATPGYAREALAAADFALGQLENNQGGAGHGGSRTPARGTEQQKLEHYGAIPQHGEADGREPSTKVGTRRQGCPRYPISRPSLLRNPSLFPSWTLLPVQLELPLAHLGRLSLQPSRFLHWLGPQSWPRIMTAPCAYALPPHWPLCTAETRDSPQRSSCIPIPGHWSCDSTKPSPTPLCVSST